MVSLATQVWFDLIVGLPILKFIHDPNFLINRNCYRNSTIVFMLKLDTSNFSNYKIYLISKFIHKQ